MKFIIAVFEELNKFGKRKSILLNSKECFYKILKSFEFLL